jgi:phosphoserine phosphatase
VDVGIFIDADGVCVKDSANLQYAKSMGVETEQKVLERDFARKKIDTQQFGREMVRLFRTGSFTDEIAKEKFEEIELEGYAEELLETYRDDIYIVSSGPSYFILRLAEKYKIPDDRCLYSVYEFDDNDKGLITRCKKPISATMKKAFVKDHLGQYDITIGVGNTPEQDLPFMLQCDFPVFVGKGKEGYLKVQDVGAICSFIGDLKKMAGQLEVSEINKKKFISPIESCKKLFLDSPYDRNVFIMTPFKDDQRYIDVIQTIRQALEQKNYKGWIASDKKLDSQLWDNVQAFMLACKYGIAVFTREGAGTGAADPTASQFNPNVTMELGFMLSRGKEVLILKDKAVNKLHTDIVGSLYQEFDLNGSKASLSDTVKDWIDHNVQ